MKKLSFLFVALAFVGFLSLNACKSSTQPASTETESVEEAPAADSASSAMADTAAAMADTTASDDAGE